MKFSTLIALAPLVVTSSAFVVNPSSITTTARPSAGLAMAQVDLVAEPLGGQELIPNSSMDGTRMKKMGDTDGLTSEDGTVYKFWLTSVAQGELIKRFKMDIMKESKKKVR